MSSTLKLTALVSVVMHIVALAPGAFFSPPADNIEKQAPSVLELSLVTMPKEITAVAKRAVKKQVSKKRPSINRAGNKTVIKGPAALKMPAPKYPWVAKKNKLEGELLLKVEVLPSGNVGEVVLIDSSGHEILDDAAITTIKKKWQFKAGSKLGKAVKSWIEVPIKFSLENA